MLHKVEVKLLTCPDFSDERLLYGDRILKTRHFGLFPDDSSNS
jgi:hypothetical protein